MTRRHFIEGLEELLLDADVLHDGLDDDVGSGGDSGGVRRSGDFRQSVGHESLSLRRIRRELLLNNAAKTFPNAVLGTQVKMYWKILRRGGGITPRSSLIRDCIMSIYVRIKLPWISLVRPRTCQPW